MAEVESQVLKVGDYLVIAAYFVFVLLVGLWVSYKCNATQNDNCQIRHHGGPKEAALVVTF